MPTCRFSSPEETWKRWVYAKENFSQSIPALKKPSKYYLTWLKLTNSGSNSSILLKKVDQLLQAKNLNKLTWHYRTSEENRNWLDCSLQSAKNCIKLKHIYIRTTQNLKKITYEGVQFSYKDTSQVFLKDFVQLLITSPYRTSMMDSTSK